MAARRQASLLLDAVPDVEWMRQRYNPAQAELIPAHVTLCREDEVSQWPALQSRLQLLAPLQLTLEFGEPVRSGDFVYLPIRSGIEALRQLRHELLANGADKPRDHDPHLTIIHPRNGRCSVEVFAEICRTITPFRNTFREVALIEQEHGQAWRRFARVR